MEVDMKMTGKCKKLSFGLSMFKWMGWPNLLANVVSLVSGDVLRKQQGLCFFTPGGWKFTL
jgi:hypothetical protein